MLTPLFGNRNFMFLWLGQSTSALGSVISQVAIMIWLAEKTDSAAALTAMLSLAALPEIILGLLAGSVCDRCSRRAIIIWGDGIKAFLCLGAATLFFLHSHGTPALILVLYIFFIGMELVEVFFQPALRALYPDVLPPSSLSAAYAVRMTTFEILSVLGKSLGGLLLWVVGLPFLLLFDGITFVASAWAALQLQVRRPATKEQPATSEQHLPRLVLQDIRAGLRYVWRKKSIRTMMLVLCGTSFFLGPITALLPFWVKDERFLNASGAWYGYLIGSIGVGILIGNWLSACHLNNRWSKFLVLFSLLFIGWLYALLGVVQSKWMALALMTANGICLGVFNTQTWIAIQKRLPSHIRGRADAAMNTLSLCAGPPSLWLVGLIADASGHRLDLIFLVCGLMTAAIGLWAQSERAFRRLLA